MQSPIQKTLIGLGPHEFDFRIWPLFLEISDATIHVPFLFIYLFIFGEEGCAIYFGRHPKRKLASYIFVGNKAGYVSAERYNAQVNMCTVGNRKTVQRVMAGRIDFKQKA